MRTAPEINQFQIRSLFYICLIVPATYTNANVIDASVGKPTVPLHQLALA